MSDPNEPGAPEKTTSASDDKQSDAGAGVTSQDFRQNHLRPPHTPPTASALPPQPHELTAEWTVRAQLTFARAGEKVQREYSSNDPMNPVRVVYKWTTLDSTVRPDDEGDDSSSTLLHKRNSSSRGSRQSTPLKTASTRRQQFESFRSTASSTGADFGGGDSAFSGSTTSKPHQQPPVYRTTTAGGDGPNGAGTATAALYGTRCRSTCNIVVSAVADFLPPDAVAAAAAAAATAANDNCMSAHATTATTAARAGAEVPDFIPEEEPDPFVFNTTASYTVLPQKSFDETTSTSVDLGSKHFTTHGKILALRDAFAQTSDTETKYFAERERRRRANSRSPIEQQQHPRKQYEQRRATAEGLVQSQTSVDEGSAFMPSFLTSPPQTLKSSSLPRIPPLPGHPQSQQQHQHQSQHTSPSQQKSSSGEAQKKPRTVHIDVYCTGSEDEDNADGEASSSSEDDGSKRHDLESNSTPQTVYDNEQIRLRHQRISGQALPRRLQQHQQQSEQQHPPQAGRQSSQTQSSQSDLQLGHAITKSSTAEEVSESKQLLFRKHIGDQRAAKLAMLRQKYIRQPSDDAISSNYPNSSHSTVRDATCSSVASSMVASSQAECGDSSWKETEELEEMFSLAKSDSFEYENSADRLRIKQMERFWSHATGSGQSSDEQNNHRQGNTSSPVRGHIQHSHLQPISEVISQRNSPFATAVTRDDTLPSESDIFSESDVFYTYPGHSLSGGFPHYQRHLQSSPVTVPQQQRQQIPAYLQQTSHFPRNRPGFLHFFGPTTAQAQPQSEPHSPVQTQRVSSSPIQQPHITSATPSPTQQQILYPNYQPNLQRWKSETRDNLSTHATPVASPAEALSQRTSPQPPTPYMPSPQRCGSEAPPATTSAATFASPMVARRFEMKHDSPSVSEASTVYSGYTTEYLEKARKFGKVVSSVRKPGHHVGPTKNPNCSCESCQRWLAERFQIRGRAFSLGEHPTLKRPT